MASIVLRLDERTVKNGQCPIRLRISHNHTAAWYATGVSVEAEFFHADDLYNPIDKRAPMYAQKKERLAAIVRQFEEGVFDLQRENPTRLAAMTATEIRDAVFGKKQSVTNCNQLKPTRLRPNDSENFHTFLDEYGSRLRSVKSQKDVQYVLNLLHAYCTERNMPYLRFSDLSYERLVDLRTWLQQTGRGEATRYKVESYIRSGFREAMRMRKVSRDNDPFLEYKIKRVPLRDTEVITAEDIRKVLSLDLSKCKGIERARDMLMVSFYLCGANFLDIYEMPKAVDGYAVWFRSKMEGRDERKMRIFIEPELESIIRKYEGKERMFNLCEHQPFNNTQWKLDTHFRELSAKAGVKINMKIIRATWTTIAASLEVPDRVIKKSTGHTDTTVQERYYEKYDWDRTRKHNRRVIDYVLNK